MQDFKDVSTDDAGARLALDFAVKTRSHLIGKTIEAAELLKVQDKEPKLGYRTFLLVLSAKIDGQAKQATAVVSSDAYGNHKLVTWE